MKWRTREPMAGDGAAEAKVAVVTVKRGCAKKGRKSETCLTRLVCKMCFSALLILLAVATAPQT